MSIAGFIIIGLTLYIYKPTYKVTLNGEPIGYTQDKSNLQARINSAIQKGSDNNVAFIQVDSMPKYELCMLKKDINTNDDEIYNKIVNDGTTYYRYYALLQDGEEKSYFSKFEDAEEVVNELKDKNSANVDKLTVVEKYNTQLAQFSDIDETVSNLYEKKQVVVKKIASSGVAAKGTNNSSNVIKLGISLIKPTTGSITSRFGYRSRDNHKGIDIASNKGTPIYAAASGTVTVAESGGYGGGYGTYLMISHGNGVQTLYGHCSQLCVSEGQTVSQGQLIAKMGSTGLSTGNHLHFEVRVNGIAQNPQNYVY